MMFEKLNIKEQVPWLTNLSVRIDCVCKIVKCLCPWWIAKINKNEWKQYVKESKFEKKRIRNILMYVKIIFGDTDLLKDIDTFSQKMWAL